MFVIGIDPHKGSHSAAVLDEHEQLVGEVRVRAGRRQRDELVAFAATVRTAVLGDRRRDRHRRAVGAAARRGR